MDISFPEVFTLLIVLVAIGLFAIERIPIELSSL